MIALLTLLALGAFGYGWHRGFLAAQRWERELQQRRAAREAALERHYDIATVHRLTLEPIGAERVPITANTRPEARN